jgi:hypothetical protein
LRALALRRRRGNQAREIFVARTRSRAHARIGTAMFFLRQKMQERLILQA